MSYAIVLTDKSINDFRHWVLWDIPAATMSLPPDLPRTATLMIPMSAKQVSIAMDGGHGYAGPCPPSGIHTYEFALYAVDVATLPGVTTNSPPAAVVTALSGMHQLARTTLTAQGMK
jgi:Raf kinase inhibitor-like YbhB/YbcL family protein